MSPPNIGLQRTAPCGLAAEAGSLAVSAILIVLLTTRVALASDTSLRMTSDPGDYIGQGQTYYYPGSVGTFSMFRLSPSVVYFAYRGTTVDDYWDLFFGAPHNGVLVVGSYPDAVRTFQPPWDPTNPRLDVGGQHRGCNQANGSFVVNQIVYASDGSVTKFWATFEQHCEGGTAALRGDVRFNADIPAAVPALTKLCAFLLSAMLAAAGVACLRLYAG